MSSKCPSKTEMSSKHLWWQGCLEKYPQRDRDVEKTSTAFHQTLISALRDESEPSIKDEFAMARRTLLLLPHLLRGGRMQRWCRICRRQGCLVNIYSYETGMSSKYLLTTRHECHASSETPVCLTVKYLFVFWQASPAGTMAELSSVGDSDVEKRSALFLPDVDSSSKMSLSHRQKSRRIDKCSFMDAFFATS